MPLSEGTVFAGYVIQRLLGAGGMGEVYLARHPRLPRLDAVKILRADLTDDANYRQRFHREADLAATLSHPRIVGVYDRGEFNGRLWISMDYVEGTDAGRLVRDNYPAGMPERDVRDIVTAVAEALDFAHRRRLLHRDVKPANILLTEPDDDERRVLLADFGIARQVDDISGLTAMNMTVGSVAYAAPEQLMGEDIDGRADQYALAATAFTLLSGAPPFPQTNPAVVIGKHLNTPAPSLAGHRPELAHLDAALSKALAKDPNDRYPRCLDFARALGQQDSATPAPDAGTAAAPTQYLNAPATPVSAAQPSRQRAAPPPPPPPASPRPLPRPLPPACPASIPWHHTGGTLPQGSPVRQVRRDCWSPAVVPRHVRCWAVLHWIDQNRGCSSIYHRPGFYTWGSISDRCGRDMGFHRRDQDFQGVCHRRIRSQTAQAHLKPFKPGNPQLSEYRSTRSAAEGVSGIDCTGEGSSVTACHSRDHVGAHHLSPPVSAVAVPRSPATRLVRWASVTVRADGPAVFQCGTVMNPVPSRTDIIVAAAGSALAGTRRCRRIAHTLSTR